MSKVHKIQLKVRDYDIVITFKDKPDWKFGDMIQDALQCFNNATGLTANDLIFIETKEE